MTALSVARAAATKIGIAVPDAVFSGTTRVLVELQTALNEAAQMVAFDTGHDWTKLLTLATIAGNGVALGFDLPTDYKRMIKKARLWSSSMPYSPFTHYTDVDQWLGTQVQSFQPVVGAWIIIGEQIQIRTGGSASPLGNTETAQFYYLSSNIVKPAAGSNKAEFTLDTDTFRLDERLLRLGLIYKWKEAKGQDYAEEMSDYENALFQVIGGDKGSNVFTIGRGRGIAEEYAFPGVIVP
jgi:hypothetical protein